MSAISFSLLFSSVVCSTGKHLFALDFHLTWFEQNNLLEIGHLGSEKVVQCLGISAMWQLSLRGWVYCWQSWTWVEAQVKAQLVSTPHKQWDITLWCYVLTFIEGNPRILLITPSQVSLRSRVFWEGEVWSQTHIGWKAGARTASKSLTTNAEMSPQQK